MRKISGLLSLLPLYLFAIAGTPAVAFECKVCHSKKPAMVRMHKETQERDISCFDCHRVGEKLMGKRAAGPSDAFQRREREKPCTTCHLR